MGKSPSPYMLLIDYVKMTVESRDRKITPRAALGKTLSPPLRHTGNHPSLISRLGADGEPGHQSPLPAAHHTVQGLTGYGLIVNTSFNVRGEPIVCSPGDAYRCFMGTGMDYLVMGDYLFNKKEQLAWDKKHDWGEEVGLD